MEVKEIKKKLKKSLDKQRYQHTLGVMYTAGCLAMANGYSIEKAMLAGLLHDCAKCLSTEKKIGLCVKKNIDITEVEISNPGLLHAKAGMVLAEEEYGIKDAQILHAIRVHTTGEADMGLLDKILFVADYIEPNRCEAPRLEEIRKLADSSRETANRIQQINSIVTGAVNNLSENAGSLVDYMKETILPEFETFVDGGVQYRENATYIENVMNEFAQKTDILKSEVDSIAGSINDITHAIEEGAKGVQGAAQSTQTLVADMDSINEKMNENRQIASALQKETDIFTKF